MCGIVGYIGNKEATPVLIGALKKLEYRGYDSAGIAVLEGDDILVRKCKGALKFLEQKIADETIKGSVGIGHTRWATHGEPSDINSHPQTNMSGSIAIVHNGIIENYAELKSMLQSKNVVFKSQTDTEVIAHLVNFYYEQNHDILKAVFETLSKLVGSYALGVVCKDYPDRIICARKDSPLVIGLGEGENFIGSDVPSFLEHTRKVLYLDQNEVAVLFTDHVDLYKSSGEKVIREPSIIDWDLSAAEKDGYEHFMIKEIHEQKKALTDTLRPRVVLEKDVPVDLNFDKVKIDGNWKKAKKIIITACGTAYHAGVVAKYAFQKIARLPVEINVASEFRYMDPVLDKDDIFIVISQSGETADSLAAMRLAKAQGLKAIAITNVVGSTVAREADFVMYTWAGPEIAVASTKAYTAQLMCLYMLALKAGAVRGTISESEYKRLLKELSNVPSLVEQLLKQKDVIQKFASQQFNKDKIFYIGRLFDSATALESALKLKEVSYMHCEAFPAGELKHGPIALVDPKTLVIGIATVPEMYEKLKSNVIECKSRGCATMVITNDKSGFFEKDVETVFVIPEVDPVFASLLSCVPAQLFAYYCSILKGIDPDKPRNLAKSVTVE